MMPESPVDGPPRKVRVVMSAPVDLCVHARDAAAELIGGADSVVFFGDRRGAILSQWAEARGGRFELYAGFGEGWLRQIAALRRWRGVTVVVAAGHRGYAGLRLSSCLAGWPNLVLVDEGGRAERLGFASAFRHGARRIGSRLLRWADLSRSAGRRLFQGGPRALIERWQERRGETRTAVALQQERSSSRGEAEAADLTVILSGPTVEETRRASVTLRRLVPEAEIIETSGDTVPALDEACRRAHGAHVLFLSADLAVSTAGVEALRAVFAARPDCGAVGAMILDARGRIEAAGGVAWRGAEIWRCGSGEDPGQPEFNYLRRVDVCSGAALMVRREALDSVGGLDAACGPAWAEDLCLRLDASGLSTWFQPASRCQRRSSAASAAAAAQELDPRSALAGKWRLLLEARPHVDPRRLLLAQDRRRGPLVMVVDQRVPRFDRDAGSAFMFEFLSTLSEMDWRVFFWPDDRVRPPAYSPPLEERGVAVLYGDRPLAEWLLRLGGALDAAIVYRSDMAAKYVSQLRPAARRLGYITVDLEDVREGRRRVVSGGGVGDAALLRRREQQAAVEADAVAIHSPVEKEVLEREFGVESVQLIPLPPPRVRAATTGFHERHHLLFVGSDHPPNVDAVEHFARHGLGELRRELGGLELWVAGDVCQALRSVRTVPGLRLLGHVPDLEPLLSVARLFVSPLRYGAGIKGKLLLALAAGLPLVTTEVGAEGLPLRDGLDALVTGGDGFTAAVKRLYSDSAAWNEIRAGGLRLFAQIGSRAGFTAAVQSFTSRLLRPEAGPAPGQPR